MQVSTVNCSKNFSVRCFDLNLMKQKVLLNGCKNSLYISPTVDLWLSNSKEKLITIENSITHNIINKAERFILLVHLNTPLSFIYCFQFLKYDSLLNALSSFAAVLGLKIGFYLKNSRSMFSASDEQHVVLIGELFTYLMNLRI
jgi:hypothetical protein